VEAVRWSLEHDVDVFLVDPDTRYRPRHRDPLPDPHTVWTLGPASYLETLRALTAREASTDDDALRERGMAFHIHTAASNTDGTLLCLLGAAHCDRVSRLLSGPTAPPMARQRRSRVELRHLHPDDLTGLLPDLPLAHAVYEHLRAGSATAETVFDDTVSRRVELVRAGLRLITGQSMDDDAERRRALAAYAARHAVRAGPDGDPVPDRAALGRLLWRVGTASYHEHTRELTTAWQRRTFFDFARRHARLQGQLVPGLYEWVVAARGVADDNLAWEVFDAARTYPWQQRQAELATVRLDGEMLDLGTRKVLFRRRFLRTKHRPVPVPVRRRPAPHDPAEWLRGFDGDMICSYPPEDLLVEDYGRHLQRRAVSILSAELSRSEPFSTSMLDGVDVRETLRRWHEEQVWVRERGRVPGEAGSVVVVFDPDRGTGRFPHLMTWLGEHDQESDMAFYSTDPTEQVVGPGIMRATYGGFMLTAPPGRLFDVWKDGDYRHARSKAEVLTMAAIDYSTERLVVHVAAAAPSPAMHDFASRCGKRLVHLPIGSLSPAALRRLRVVHILSGRDKREIARDYVW
jgi:hypothetical protein